MNTELDNTTTFLAQELISENATRGALDRRQPNLSTVAADARDGRPAQLRTAADGAAPRASRSRPLRRWSVAELLARAVPRPPHGGVAH